jgi:prevent-host-death family protein
MLVVNMLEAKTNLSKLVEAVESGSEAEIFIARNGKPAAKLTSATTQQDISKRIGLFDGKYPPMSFEDFDAKDKDIERLFYGDEE